MHIYWHGQNCFKIVSKDVTLITDPFGTELGIKPPRTGANIVTLSCQDYNAGGIKNDPLIFDTPGEYEAKGVLLRGFWSYRDKEQGKKLGVNNIFTMEVEGLRLCHLGDIGHALDDKLENKIDGVDILFVPVGNSDVIDSKKAVEIVKQIEPSLVIPMHFKLPGLKPKLKDAQDFLREMGFESTKPENKLLIKKKDLDAEKTEVKILKTS